MFDRIIHEDWTTIIPMISFWIIFLVFLGAAIRSLVMKKSEVERMAALPLDDRADRPRSPLKTDT